MHVAVGTKNPAKISAVEAGFRAVWPDEHWEFTGVGVQSGIADQPMSSAEGITGARNRAHAALDAVAGASYGAGLEGCQHQEGGIWFTTAWIFIVDTNGREGIGGSPAVMTTPRIVEMIQDGVELGDATDEVFGKTNTKHHEGYFGLITDNLITRSEGYKQGVIMALARFLHPEIF